MKVKTPATLIHFLVFAVAAQEPNGAKMQGEDEHHHAHARNHNVRRRRLLDSDFLTDPRSVGLKQTSTSTTVAATPAAEAASRVIPAPYTDTDVPHTVVGDAAPASLSILSLGGSVTWGATLEHQSQAYPGRIGHALGGATAHVDNLAMPATGADFPAVCIQTQINELPSSDEREYDLILLDFRMNGTTGFPLLLSRLRKRFPEAVIVYVTLFSFKNNINEEGTNKTCNDLGLDPKVNWVWNTVAPNAELVSPTEALVKEAGGYVYVLPRAESPQTSIAKGLFSFDWHHLSAHGHALLANALVRFLEIDGKREQVEHQPKRIGKWGGGDQCYNWLMTGNVPLPYQGAEKENFLKDEPNRVKWVLSVSPGGMSIEFNSEFDHPVPVALAYMSRKEPAYPHALITVNDDVENAVVIEPSKTGWVGVHIVVYEHVGIAKPGHNVLRLTPLQMPFETTPFRVVGIYMCGVCNEFDNFDMALKNIQPIPL